MSKFVKKLSASTAPAPSSTETKFDAAKFAFHVVEVTGGKKFEVGLKADCVKAGISRFGKPYCIIVVDDAEEFIDPRNLKPLKPIAAEKAALVKSEMEAAREATIIVGGLIKNETEKAVLIAHSGWFKAKWFPKTFVTKVGEHDDGEQSLFEVPLWKIRADMGPDAVSDLEELQTRYETMMEPAKPEPVVPAGKSMVVGKTALIKRKAK